jgi:hypothetical protein
MTPGIVQAHEADFQLHTLGWKAFQDLCLSITGEVLGQTVQSFLSSQDGGRDGAFTGQWLDPNGTTLDGTFVIQCKFTSKQENTLRVSDLSDEFTKARGLAASGSADNYILMTNHRLSAVEEEKIRSSFQQIAGVRNFVALGREWITQQIRERPRLRMMVPRVYGLGDLSTILDERAYTQARVILEFMGEDLRKFVLTNAHRKSVEAILEHGFVLLLGEPAAGKSTIAATLSVGAADLWGASALKLKDADDLIAHWNPNESSQFFWIDDAFGATQYDRTLALQWNRVFPHVLAAIRRGSKVVMTSRDYIFNAARYDLKTTAFPLLNQSKVIIEVEDLTASEREQILYNHMKLGDQPVAFRTLIKNWLPTVAEHANFRPEIARRLGTRLFTRNLTLDPKEINNFVARPLQWLVDVIRTLDEHSRAALALVFMSGGVLPSPLQLSPEEIRAIELMGSSIGAVRSALAALQPSLVQLLREGGVSEWRFKHPTIRDAFASVVAEDPELLDIYLAGTPVSTMLQEIACGRSEIRGVRVVVPHSRYDAVLKRLVEVRDNQRVCSFLDTRCDDSFVEVFVRYNPAFLKELPVYSYLSVVPEVAFIATLKKRGLLPEDVRLSVVERIAELAVDTPDADWLEVPRLRALLTDVEIQEILERIRDELLPNLSEVISDWKSDYNEGDPEAYFDSLTSALTAYERALNDTSVEETMKQAFEEISEAASDLSDDYAPAEEWTGLPDDQLFDGSDMLNRSIFDDIDE